MFIVYLTMPTYILLLRYSFYTLSHAFFADIYLNCLYYCVWILSPHIWLSTLLSPLSSMFSRMADRCHDCIPRAWAESETYLSSRCKRVRLLSYRCDWNRTLLPTVKIRRISAEMSQSLLRFFPEIVIEIFRRSAREFRKMFFSFFFWTVCPPLLSSSWQQLYYNHLLSFQSQSQSQPTYTVKSIKKIVKHYNPL